MHPDLQPYCSSFSPSGNLAQDVQSFLGTAGYARTAQHCQRVSLEAGRLAARFAAPPEAAEAAGWLHDVSAVVPNRERVELTKKFGLELLSEEQRQPMILHQKLSVVFARELFSIRDAAILSAIGCHTTLKAGAGRLDKVVFLADKIAWDQDGEPPYAAGIRQGLEQSLEAGVLAYLTYLWQHKDQLPVVHPWFVDAYQELSRPA